MILWACIGISGLTVLRAAFNPATPDAPSTPMATKGATATVEEKKNLELATRPVASNNIKPILQPAVAPSATSKPQATDTPAPTVTPDDPVQSIAIKQCGARLRTAQIVDGTYLVACKLAENFTQSWMVGGAVDDLTGMAKQAFLMPEVKAITVQIIGDFKDEYGNATELPAFTFRLTRQLYAKINWANTSANDVARLIDKKRDGSSAGVAPAWRASWREFIQ